MQLFDSVSRWLSDMPVVRRTRNAPRVIVDTSVLVRTTGDEATSIALLRDLSIGGACIRCDYGLAVNDLVWVHLRSNAGDDFEFTAAVVDERPHELGFIADYGLRIVEMNVASARALADYIGDRLERA